MGSNPTGAFGFFLLHLPFTSFCLNKEEALRTARPPVKKQQQWKLIHITALTSTDHEGSSNVWSDQKEQQSVDCTTLHWTLPWKSEWYECIALVKLHEGLGFWKLDSAFSLPHCRSASDQKHSWLSVTQHYGYLNSLLRAWAYWIAAFRIWREPQTLTHYLLYPDSIFLTQ